MVSNKTKSKDSVPNESERYSKYTVVDNKSENTHILIKYFLYAPILNTIRLSLWQLAQQSTDPWVGDPILGDALYLRWDNQKNIVPYYSSSNLSMISTVP